MKARTLLPAIFIFSAVVALAAEPDKGLTVHEWGTFTSVQGSDGVQVPWNPFVAPELPLFVYDRGGPRLNGVGISFTKTSFMTRQRMETPVLYFYSDRALTADVAVRFPQGVITEWYPDKSAADPQQIVPGMVGAGASPALHWRQVQVLPPSADAAPLPTDNTGSHYYAARETDASLVRTTSGKKSETEKFLFYRGIASFTAPLTVKPVGDDAALISLRNTGAEELTNLFVYEVRADGRLAWINVPKLAPNQSQTADMSQAASTDANLLAAALRSALVREGLYEKEAAAMVKTWESSWFSERGVRVLYTLPRAWTDRTLPLAIQPAPKSIERVMVGRAEIITPQMEMTLLDKINRYVAAKPEERAKIVEETRDLGLGRFIDPVMIRVQGGEHSQDFFRLSWELVNSTRATPKAAAKL